MSLHNILVTGGAGFLGSNLCKRLLNLGTNVQVYALDDLSTGSKDNIITLEQYNNFHFIEADVISLPSILYNIHFSEIYNLAAPASPPLYQSDPVKTSKTIYVGTLNTLELAHKNKARFLQASTSEVYGDPLISPQSEEYNGNVSITGPRSCYDESKRAAESLCFDYFRMHGLDFKVVRIFNTYGPGMNENDGRVISNFITQALRGDDITIYGDGTQTRSFCYVDDLIDGICALMLSNFRGVMNLGNNMELSVKRIAKEILNKTATASKIIHLSLPQDDPKKRCPDLALAKKILAYEPKVSLDEGLNRTIDYFSDKLRKQQST